jgi:hypothetical protein
MANTIRRRLRAALIRIIESDSIDMSERLKAAQILAETDSEPTNRKEPSSTLAVGSKLLGGKK